ncbi:MAG: aspartate-semialdehyde dehydrogenase [Desulfobacterales bacterium]|nr:aspartate-semialdehyde dehydrogenase [Desulfobacterales bacterium]
MVNVAFIGWRGMVGSVLMNRMQQEGDFKPDWFEPLFMSTTQVGQAGPTIGFDIPVLQDAYDIEKLSRMEIIVTCQGGDYTSRVYPELRKTGWDGYWIDAASTLRMKDDSIIVLDPVNRNVIEDGLITGIRNYIGGNCTVSLMLMAIGVLFQKGYVEWMTTMTYQAASGAGAKNMRELISQMEKLGTVAKPMLNNPDSAILELDRLITETIRNDQFPVEQFGVPLAGSIIPWIDRLVEQGQTREEWKGYAETNKILRSDPMVPIDGICVRVGAMRCHSQGLTIKLNQAIPMDELEQMIAESNEWVQVIPNTKEETLRRLTPAAVSGKLDIPVGRIRKLTIGDTYLTAFTVGDQLLWGAAEPIRRILNIILEYLS